MKINNLACRIQVNWRDADEYGEQATDGGRTKACYIASQDGAPFQFVLDFTDPKNHGKEFTYNILADGKLGVYAYSKAVDAYSSFTYAQTYIRTPTSNGMFEQRPFKFGKLETAETKKLNVESRIDVLKELGSLKVIIWECKSSSTNAALAYNAPNLQAAAETNPILEKSLKGRSVPHQTSLGDASYRTSITYNVDLVQPAAATFVFRYTSKESLKNQRIIPKEDAEEDIEDGDEDEDEGSSDGIDNMSMEEMRRELRCRREAEAADEDDLPHKVKKEIKPEVKQEPKKKRHPQDPVEVIDLLDDDDD